jgi:hypothetical protein
MSADRLEELSAEMFLQNREHVSVGGVISFAEEIYLLFVLWITDSYSTPIPAPSGG